MAELIFSPPFTDTMANWFLVGVSKMQIAVDTAIHALCPALVGLRSDGRGDPFLKFVLVALR